MFHQRLAKNLTNYRDGNSIGSRLRRRRIGPLIDMIRSAFNRRGVVSIVDIGGSQFYWDNFPPDFLADHGVHVTIVNSDSRMFQPETAFFTNIRADGCDLAAFETGHFDIAHSNSVIEHVGDWSRMAAFAREQMRVGRACFAQTPNFWFPIEPHYVLPIVHWLPRPILVHWLARAKLGNSPKCSDLGKAFDVVDGIRLLDRRMFSHLFSGCQIVDEKIGFLTKSFVAIRHE